MELVIVCKSTIINMATVRAFEVITEKFNPLKNL